MGALWTAPGCGSEWVHVPASCRTLLLGAEDPLPRLSPSPSGHSGWKPRGSWSLLLPGPTRRPAQPGGHTCETSGEPGRPRGSCHRPWWLTHRFSRRGCSQKPVSYPVPSGADWQWLLHSPVRWLAALAMWPKCPIVALTFTSLTLTMLGGNIQFLNISGMAFIFTAEFWLMPWQMAFLKGRRCLVPLGTSISTRHLDCSANLKRIIANNA